MMSRRKFSKEFKVAAIRRLQGGQTAAEVARALEVHPSELHRWRQELDEYGERAFQGVGKKRAEESRVRFVTGLCRVFSEELALYRENPPDSPTRQARFETYSGLWNDYCTGNEGS